ncbi:DMT family transporter [Ferdinandcohnia quinoae]|uniref:DMT family transporter n=1 Tax=Fredinandcohnia quinoae TaxID=2918902 RepID=A0AAW5E4F5_9BACI|nr:DMT family transporter [Fredinandcohnia sp. SECRCQ15]MCH1624221.1 DMT family transporter [Fredinandcohnia sp. SECRCQ15]
MKGVIFSIVAGVFISLQGVFNSKLSEVLSPWHTTTIVHLVGFITSFIIFLMIRDGKSKGFREVPFAYLIGGMFGVVIVIGEMRAIHILGMSLAVATLLISQLICAFIIDVRGLFGVIKLKITSQQIIGMIMILAGIVIFKL